MTRRLAGQLLQEPGREDAAGPEVDQPEQTFRRALPEIAAAYVGLSELSLLVRSYPLGSPGHDYLWPGPRPGSPGKHSLAIRRLPVEAAARSVTTIATPWAVTPN